MKATFIPVVVLQSSYTTPTIKIIFWSCWMSEAQCDCWLRKIIGVVCNINFLWPESQIVRCGVCYHIEKFPLKKVSTYIQGNWCFLRMKIFI